MDNWGHPLARELSREMILQSSSQQSDSTNAVLRLDPSTVLFFAVFHVVVSWILLQVVVAGEYTARGEQD
jgi:hypothetical protein